MNDHPKPTKADIEKVQKILKKRNLGLFLMLLFLPSVIIISEVTKSEILTGLVGLIIFAIIGVLLVQANFSMCPCCNNNFFTKGPIANGFTSQCVHCGLSGRMPKKFRKT